MIKKIRKKRGNHHSTERQEEYKRLKTWRIWDVGRWKTTKQKLEIRNTWEEKRSVSTTNRNKNKDARQTWGRCVIEFSKEDDWLLVAD